MSTLRFSCDLSYWSYPDNNYIGEKNSYQTGEIKLMKYNFGLLANKLAQIENNKSLTKWYYKNGHLDIIATYHKQVNVKDLAEIILKTQQPENEISSLVSYAQGKFFKFTVKVVQVFEVTEEEIDINTVMESVEPVNFKELEEPKRIGLALCHGKFHNQIRRNIYELVDKWIYLDINESANPDIVGDVKDPQIQELLTKYAPDGYDVIVSMYCPNTLIYNIIEMLRKFIKPRGKLIVMAMVTRLSRELSKKLSSEISDKLSSEISDKFSRNNRILKSLEQKYKNGDEEIINELKQLLQEYLDNTNYSSAYLLNNDGYFIN